MHVCDGFSRHVCSVRLAVNVFVHSSCWWSRYCFQDYYDIIKNPIDLATIKSKLDNGTYTDPWQYCDDIWLMFENAWAYNRKTSRVYKWCSRVRQSSLSSSASFVIRTTRIWYDLIFFCLYNIVAQTELLLGSTTKSLYFKNMLKRVIWPNSPNHL